MASSLNGGSTTPRPPLAPLQGILRTPQPQPQVTFSMPPPASAGRGDEDDTVNGWGYSSGVSVGAGSAAGDGGAEDLDDVHRLLPDDDEGVATGEDASAFKSCSSVTPLARFCLVIMLLLAVVGAFIGLLLGNGAGAPQPAPRLRRPLVVNTWWAGSTQSAWAALANGSSALDAVELAGTYSEAQQFDTTVGWDGSVDSRNETTLDALIMDGATMDVGAVGDLRRVRHAIAAARKVMHYSTHTMLAGDGATDFSVMMGLAEETLQGPVATAQFAEWLADSCQPNYFDNVVGGNVSCPPYVPVPTPSYTPLPRAGHAAAAAPNTAAPLERRRHRPTPASQRDHDTLGMCAIDVRGNVALGMTSNGARHKVAGRIGDAPVVGAGGYASNEAGCAAATGDGDITMRFLPAYQAVENMRRGMRPDEACAEVVRRIERFYPSFELGILCVGTDGSFGAASHGWNFTYCASSADLGGQPHCFVVKALPGETSSVSVLLAAAE